MLRLKRLVWIARQNTFFRSIHLLWFKYIIWDTSTVHIICSALERSSTPHKLCRMIHICFLMESAFLQFKVDRTQYSARNLIDGHPITCISTRIASLTFIMLCFETNCSCGSICWMYRLQSAICHGECTHDSLVAGNVRNHTTRVFYLNLIQWGLNIFLAVGMEGLTQYQGLSIFTSFLFTPCRCNLRRTPARAQSNFAAHSLRRIYS